MTKEVCLLLAFRPEFDGVGQGIHRLEMTADEGAPEVDMLKLVLLGLQVGDLTDVVTAVR